MQKQTLIVMTLASWAVCLALPEIARTASWQFEEVIVDENPLQDDRVTDIEIVDINNDGRPDIWCSGTWTYPAGRRPARYSEPVRCPRLPA